MNLRQWIVD